MGESGITTPKREPEVTQTGFLDMQVCVPVSWTDEEVSSFAERENPAGTKGGWAVRKEGSEYLAGASERTKCKDRPGFVHIMLDA